MTIEQIGASIKAEHPEYSDLTDLDLGTRMVNKFPELYKDKLSQKEKTTMQKFGDKWKGGSVPQLLLGASKEIGKQANTISKAGQKGLQYVTSPLTDSFNIPKPPVAQINPALLEQKGGWQKAGGKAVQFGEFMGASGEALTNLSTKIPGLAPKVIGGVSQAPGVIAQALGQAATSGGVAALQEGEYNKNVRNTMIIAGAIPFLAAGVKSLFGPEKLIQKASGLTPKQASDLDQIAQIQNKSTGKPNYKGIKDWMLQHFSAGSREDMANQADDLFKATTESKKEALAAISERIPNSDMTKKMIDILKQQYGEASKYGGLGNESIIKELGNLRQAKNFTATQFDRIRYLLDDMPNFSTDNPAAQGIRNIVGKMRQTLASLDPSGEIAKQNVDKMILMELSKYGKGLLKRASFRNVFTGMAPSGVTAAAGKYLLGGVPGVGAAVAGVGLAEAATSIPTVASGIAKGITNTANALKPAGVKGLKDILRAGTTMAGLETSRFFTKPEIEDIKKQYNLNY